MLLVLALVVLAYQLWLPLLGEFLVVSDPLRPAEVVVPLAGNPGRIVYSAQLFQAGYAPRFAVTNMAVNVPDDPLWYADWARRIAVERGVPEDRILVAPERVASTEQEAVAIRHLAEANGFHSVLVVTDAYHTRRARWILSGVFQGTGITVSVVPIEPSDYRAATWWQDPTSLEFTLSEYAKMAAHLVGYQ